MHIKVTNWCLNGEIHNASCGDKRDKICVETRIEENNSVFSAASCNTNLAYACLDYNTLGKVEGLKKCRENQRLQNPE